MKYFFLFVFLLSMLLSCNKEDSIITIDHIPDYNIPIDTIYDNEINLDSRAVSFERSVLSIVRNEMGNPNYFELNLYSSLFDDLKNGLFYAAFPCPSIDSIENGIYNGFISYTLTSKGLKIFQDWVDNGSNPDNVPNLDSEIIAFNAEELVLKISNSTTTTADVSLSGRIKNIKNEDFNIEGDFIVTVVN